MLDTLTAPAAALPVVPRVRTGSQTDAKRLRARLQQVLAGAVRVNETLELLVETAREHAIYLMLQGPDGRYFDTWEAFCVAPVPYGLGIPAAALHAVILERTDPQARARRALTAAPVRLLPTGGQPGHAPTRRPKGADMALPYPKPRRAVNGGDYWLARLRRDHPELLRKVATGALPSIMAAAVEAGLVQRRLTVVGNPMAMARAIVCEFSEAEQAQILALLQHPERITPPPGKHGASWKRYQARRQARG
jgi:hypothetical protein